MDMYINCLINENYIMLVETILCFLCESFDSEIRYIPHNNSQDDDYNVDYIGCEMFSMNINTATRSKEFDRIYGQEVFGTPIDTMISIDVGTDFIRDALPLIYKLARKIESVFGEVIVESDTSKVIYKKTASETVFDQEFWKFEQ